MITIVWMALAGAAPSQILHQGRLLDASGQPMDGSLSASFAVYDVASGGAALHSEAETLLVQDGYYTASLGPFPSPVLSASDLWVEVTVGSATLAPRTPIFASFHSLNPGPQGPAGATGPQGPPGPQGPAGAGAVTLGSRPTSPTAGVTWYNATTRSLELYDGTQWVPLGARYADNTATCDATTTSLHGSVRYRNHRFEGCTAAGWAFLGGGLNDGSSTNNPAETCKTLHADFPDLDTGSYFLDPDGTGPIAAFSAYCEMDMAGGGWTLVGRKPVNSSTPTLANTGAVGTLSSPTQSTPAKLSDTLWNALIRTDGTRIVVESGYTMYSEPWALFRTTAANPAFKGSTVGTGCVVSYSKNPNGWYPCQNNGYCGGDVLGHWGTVDGGNDEIRWETASGCGIYTSGGPNRGGTAWVR
jgi:hypothetical protein